MAPAWWRRYLDWRLRNVRSLVLGAEGFAIMARGRRQSVYWDDVRNVTPFKRDLMTVDLVCLAIATASAIVEIDEDMPGYCAVEAELCSRLAIGQEWRMAVVFPAFATNPTILFTAA